MLVSQTFRPVNSSFQLIFFESLINFSKFVGVGLRSTLHEDSIRISSSYRLIYQVFH